MISALHSSKNTLWGLKTDCPNGSSDSNVQKYRTCAVPLYCKKSFYDRQFSVDFKAKHALPLCLKYKDLSHNAYKWVWVHLHFGVPFITYTCRVSCIALHFGTFCFLPFFFFFFFFSRPSWRSPQVAAHLDIHQGTHGQEEAGDEGNVRGLQDKDAAGREET